MTEAAARRQGKVFVISSPSGGGKTTVIRRLLGRVPKLVRSVSVTTRPPRPSERHGVDYRFVSVEVFKRLQRQGDLLEWAQVHQAYYGTPRPAVERIVSAGCDVVLSIDVQGAKQVRRRFGTRAVLIFLLPPSLRDLRARLMKRRTETPESMRERLRAAHRELACVEWYDYGVVNQSLERAVEQVRAIIVAERLRVHGSKPQGGS